MIKRLLLLVLLLILSVWAGLEIRQDPGYILIAYHFWTVEMPVWAGVLLLVLGFTLFYLLLRMLSVTGSIGSRWHAWLLRQRKRKAENRTTQGLLELFEGNWAPAENNLVRAAAGSQTPLLNYLAAAYAAQEQYAYDRRDGYLRLAHQTTPDAEVAVGLIQARMQLSHRQSDAALVSLKQVLVFAPKQQQALQMLKDLCLQTHDWTQLAELLPRLRKAKAVTAAETEVLQRAIYQHELTELVQKSELSLLQAYWQTLPKDLHSDMDFLKIYIPAVIAEHTIDVEKILRDALKKQWDNQLIKWYGFARGKDAAKQLAAAEIWLKQYPDNPILLNTVARLCLHNQLWGKARSYLEYSLQLLPQAETYLLLADLLNQLNEKEKSFDLYRKGLAFALPTDPGLGKPY